MTLARPALLVLLLLGGTLPAAPVPKGLKAKPTTADGVWECVEFNGYNGKISGDTVVGTFWKVAGDKMSFGKKTPDDHTDDDLSSTLRIPDASKPHLRELLLQGATKYSVVLERDGDTLRWAWCPDEKKMITECQPAADVYYYVFKLVKK